MRKYYLLIIIIVITTCQDDLKELRDHLEHKCENPDHKYYDKFTLSYITPWYLYFK